VLLPRRASRHSCLVAPMAAGLEHWIRLGKSGTAQAITAFRAELMGPWRPKLSPSSSGRWCQTRFAKRSLGPSRGEILVEKQTFSPKGDREVRRRDKPAKVISARQVGSCLSLRTGVSIQHGIPSGRDTRPRGGELVVRAIRHLPGCRTTHARS